LQPLLDRPLPLQDAIQLPELGKGHGRVQFTDPKIQSEDGMLLGASIISHVVMPVIGEHMGRFVNILILGDDGPALASGDDLEEIKGKTSNLPESPYVPSSVSSAQGRSGILDQNETMLFTDTDDLFQSGHGTEQMNHEHRFRARGDSGFDALRGETEGFVYLGEYRHGAHRQYTLYGCDKGKRWNDDFVPCPDAHRSEGNEIRRRSAGAHMAVTDPMICGKFLFEGPRLPDALSRTLIIVPKKDAGLQDIHYLSSFLVTEQFRSRHIESPL
jgi:hypothetical protein